MECKYEDICALAVTNVLTCLFISIVFLSGVYCAKSTSKTLFQCTNVEWHCMQKSNKFIIISHFTYNGNKFSNNKKQRKLKKILCNRKTKAKSQHHKNRKKKKFWISKIQMCSKMQRVWIKCSAAKILSYFKNIIHLSFYV